MSDDAKVSLGKGRPTPKRSEATRRRTGPVPPPPADRKEAARRLRAERAEERRAVRAGTATGGARGAGTGASRLLARDQGPVRAMVRDLVDARRNLPVLLMPVALLLVVAQLLGQPVVLGFASGLWYATFFAALLDLVLVGIAVRRRLRADFPAEPPLRHVGYGLLRTTVLRRLRTPPPRVHPGSWLPRRR